MQSHILSIILFTPLVGALLLARAVDDLTLSDEIIVSTARALHGHVERTDRV